MERWLRYWWLAVIFIGLSLGYNGWQRWQLWNSYERIVVWDNWTVALPQGGSITYRNQSPRSRPMIGPADTTKLLIWQKANGQTHQYMISDIGGGLQDLEFFERPNGRGVWLTSWNRRQITAALDFDTGKCIAGGHVYDKDGQETDAPEVLPSWTKVSLGRSIGRKKF